MQALLGKITGINRQSTAEEPAVTGDGHSAPLIGLSPSSLEVKFKGACVLPQRTNVPEWLKDQVLTIQREVIAASNAVKKTLRIDRPSRNLVPAR